MDENKNAPTERIPSHCGGAKLKEEATATVYYIKIIRCVKYILKKLCHQVYNKTLKCCREKKTKIVWILRFLNHFLI